MITPLAMSELFQNDVEQVTSRLTKEEAELATGRRVSSPQVDPAAASQDIELQAALAQNGTYQSDAQDAVSWLSETTTMLQSVSQYLSRAYQLAIEGANGTTSSADLAALAQEAASLEAMTQQVQATVFEGMPLFGGATGTVYQREIGAGLVVPVNVTLNQAFQQTNVDGSLSQLVSDLQSGNSANLSSDAQAIQNAQSALLAVMASVGANQSLAQEEEATLQNQEVALTTADQQAIGADAAQVAANFSQDQTIYQDALAAWAKILQPSLINYLS